MTPRRIIAGITVAALASVLVYAVMLILSDAKETAAALRAFPLGALVAMCALSTVSFGARAARWQQLMRMSGHPISFGDAFYLQLSGQAMTLSPGRIGEILKPYLARDLGGMPMTRGIALVFSERVADLIAVFILSLGGLSAIHAGPWTVGGALVVLVVGTLVASSRWFHGLALGVVERQKWARKHHASATAISETLQSALSWQTLLWSIPASVFAWGLEGVVLWMCLQALGFGGLAIWTAVSVYAVSIIVGALTFLPGGIGITEASMAGILIALGASAADASAATLITRVATLWFGVALGWIVLALRPKVLTRALAETAAEG